MRFDDKPNPSRYGLSHQSGHLDLSARMQVDLWLLDKIHLTRLGHSKRREDRKNLRDTQADVGDADKIAFGVALLSLKCPAYLDFDLCVTDGRRSDLPVKPSL